MNYLLHKFIGDLNEGGETGLKNKNKYNLEVYIYSELNITLIHLIVIILF